MSQEFSTGSGLRNLEHAALRKILEHLETDAPDPDVIQVIARDALREDQSPVDEQHTLRHTVHHMARAVIRGAAISLDIYQMKPGEPAIVQTQVIAPAHGVKSEATGGLPNDGNELLLRINEMCKRVADRIDDMQTPPEQRN